MNEPNSKLFWLSTPTGIQFIGIDMASGKDVSCVVHGNKDSEGIINVTKVETDDRAIAYNVKEVDGELVSTPIYPEEMWNDFQKNKD